MPVVTRRVSEGEAALWFALANASGYHSPIAIHLSPITYHLLPVTFCRSPVTIHLLPVTLN